MILTIFVALGAGTASAATYNHSFTLGNSAVIANHGQQPGDNCSLTFVGGLTYSGFISHLVITPSGIFDLGCVLFGMPTDTKMIGSGNNKVQANPGGVAILSFNGR
jgi:hypothetical protein